MYKLFFYKNNIFAEYFFLNTLYVAMFSILLLQKKKKYIKVTRMVFENKETIIKQNGDSEKRQIFKL